VSQKKRPKKPLRAPKAQRRPIRAPKRPKPLRLIDATRGGRPSKYRIEYARVAEVMVRGGSTDFELAQALGVTRATIYVWKAQHAEFSDAIAGARAIPIERVERSLYERAIGYTHEATKLVVVKDQVTAVTYLEHVPPDVHAASLWLRNVDPMRWRERHEIAVEKPEDKRTERELTDDEIYARLAAIEEERKKLGAIDAESIDVTPAPASLPVLK
jgi:hypothetical protein